MIKQPFRSIQLFYKVDYPSQCRIATKISIQTKLISIKMLENFHQTNFVENIKSYKSSVD